MNILRTFREIKEALKCSDEVAAQLALAEAVAFLATTTIDIDIGTGRRPVKIEHSQR